MKIGIIGVGIIGTAIATGFCESHDENLKLILSPRGRERAQALKEKYPEQVEIAASNQEVVDRAEWVFLAVLPEQAEPLIQELTFRPEQKFINLVATLGVERARAIIGELSVIADVVPLPFNARHIGPIILYPPIREVQELLSQLGTVVSVNTPEQMAVLRSTTALMSPYYELLASVTDWCTEQGLEEKQARSYLTSFFGALSVIASGWEDGLHQLAGEMTPGGLNWQALKGLEEQGNFTQWKEILDPVLKRVIKK